MFKVTEKAIEEIKKAMQEYNMTNSSIRIDVLAGCSVQFSMNFIEQKDVSLNDIQIQISDVNFVVNNALKNYLEETELDYLTSDCSGFCFNSKSPKSGCCGGGSCGTCG